MIAENLQDAVWLLFAGEYGREKRVAKMLNVDRSTVSRWAHGDSPVSIETVAAAEKLLDYYPVTSFLSQRVGKK